MSTPQVGDLVRYTLYQPDTDPPKSVIYKQARVMLVRHIVENYQGQPGITRYVMADPDRPNDVSHFSWSESDWADLEPMNEELGTLF